MKKKTIDEEVEETKEKAKPVVSTERPEVIEQHRVMREKAEADQKLVQGKRFGQ